MGRMRLPQLISGLVLLFFVPGCASTAVEPPKITTALEARSDLGRTPFSKSIQGLEAQIKSLVERQEDLIARVPPAFSAQSESGAAWIWFAIAVAAALSFGFGIHFGKRSIRKDIVPVSRPRRMAEAA